MRAEAWKKLFREKGWVQGSRIIQPKGCRLGIYFRGSLVNLDDFTKNEVEVTETFLKITSPDGDGWTDEVFHPWEDIETVILKTKT